MKGNKMKLLQKLLLSAVITCSFTTYSFTGQSCSKGAGKVILSDFFAIIPDKFLAQVIQTTLTLAANDDPTLCQFVNTFNSLKATSHKFREMLNNAARGENILIQALGNSTIHLNKALLEIAQNDKRAWLIPLLVKAGANINAQDGFKSTPLHIAIFNCHLPVLQKLVRLGANVNAQDKTGRTPLHYAVIKRHLPAVQELIHADANVNQRDYDGITPLHIAASCDHQPIVHELIQAKANVNAQDIYGRTPLHLAVSYNHQPIIHELIQAGANVNK